MKRLLFLITIITISFNALAQDITGEWNGLLKVQGMKLRIVFHISKTDNRYAAAMDSPDQGAKGIPMSAVTFVNNVLTLEMKAASIKYISETISSDSIKGTFAQMGQKFPLNLYRKEVVQQKPKRPQEPTLPYPYKSEDITFYNAKDNIRLYMD
ncbi:MAG: hypothetical protein Q7U47_08965 [Paludibacter sp.]|nr:hypothetical protein [Paludibacter sp.]